MGHALADNEKDRCDAETGTAKEQDVVGMVQLQLGKSTDDSQIEVLLLVVPAV